ncbi:hypothetical protein ON010_g17239 [Phytophthora cinnamomi]|nr:hypothetical protein ON010_g17239 [Phytophthora cinnamomi]
MVYSPSTYLISAVVAAVALQMQMQQTAASSLYYTPFTVSDTTDEITNKFPGYGGHVTEQDCLIQVEIDPTLPNITTIAPVPVTYPDLLANLTTAPAVPVYSKVGSAILKDDTPSTEAGQDSYIAANIPSTDGKIGKGGVNEQPKDCADWVGGHQGHPQAADEAPARGQCQPGHRQTRGLLRH